eukprot:59108-Amphidinium_carterae.2
MFDEVHGWICNYFNNIDIGVEEDNDQSPPKKQPYKPWWHSRWTRGKGSDKGKGKDNGKGKGNKGKNTDKAEEEAMPSASFGKPGNKPITTDHWRS